MKKNVRLTGFVLILPFIISLYFFGDLQSKSTIAGKVYFNKPVSWDNVYSYVYNANNLILEAELKHDKDYIYYLSVTSKMMENIKEGEDYKIIFSNGIDNYAQYKVEADFLGYNKIYNITNGIGEFGEITEGEWVDYTQNIKFGKIPVTENVINNVIYMIGDGMGENHIIAGNLYKEEELNIQKLRNKSYVITSSLSTVTDSAASATALATGYKTMNGVIGKDKIGNNPENLVEYANSKGLKTGIVCTQILNHATPASFSAHNTDRYNYDEIITSQLESNIDLMFGGGREYFKKFEVDMKEKGYKWINNFYDLEEADKYQKIIGTFANNSIGDEEDRISLADMTVEALKRLENDEGFFLMVEGSNIDTYSHENDMNGMLYELMDFDDAVGVAKKYVDEHPDTLLIVTADHETGGLLLDNIKSSKELTNDLFTSNGQHTSKNVLLYAYGICAKELTQYDVIDNTSIHKFVKQGLSNKYNKSLNL